MWLPGKCDFPGNGKHNFLENVTSQEKWLPGKYDFWENNSTWEVDSWESWLLGRVDFLGELTRIILGII